MAWNGRPRSGWYRKTKNDIVPLEADEQKMLFQWAEYAVSTYPELGLLFAIPNGGFRFAKEAHNLKLQGVKAGVPDICLPVPRGGYGALYIELKRVKRGRVSEEQRIWIDALSRAGNRAVVCKGALQAQKEIENYLRG